MAVQRVMKHRPWRSVVGLLAAEDQDPDYPPVEYFCELDVTVAHPEVETNDYQVEVTYPGANSERTLTLNLVESDVVEQTFEISEDGHFQARLRPALDESDRRNCRAVSKTPGSTTSRSKSPDWPASADSA